MLWRSASKSCALPGKGGRKSPIESKHELREGESKEKGDKQKSGNQLVGGGMG